MRTPLVLAPMAALIFFSGCQAIGRESFVSTDRTTVSFDAALRSADGRADAILKETAARPVAPDEKTARDPHWVFQQERRTKEERGAFVLTVSDYWKRVSLYTEAKRPVMSVAYFSAKPVAKVLRATHFGVLVFLDTGETRAFGTGNFVSPRDQGAPAR